MFTEGGGNSGLKNELFDEDGSVIPSFSSIEKAHHFRYCVHCYFDDAILAALKVKRRAKPASTNRGKRL